jgi:hypothetical protein
MMKVLGMHHTGAMYGNRMYLQVMEGCARADRNLAWGVAFVQFKVRIKANFLRKWPIKSLACDSFILTSTFMRLLN